MARQPVALLEHLKCDAPPHVLGRSHRQVRRLRAARSGHHAGHPHQFPAAARTRRDMPQSADVCGAADMTECQLHQVRRVRMVHGALLRLGLGRPLFVHAALAWAERRHSRIGSAVTTRLAR